MNHQPHAVAALIGDRTHQCDATATDHNAATGATAFVLLDGIGSTPAVQKFTVEAAHRLASAAAHDGDAATALAAVHAAYVRQPDPFNHHNACAVVAVTLPGKPLTVAWCGDARAYFLTPSGVLSRLTVDHNMEQVALDAGRNPGPYDHNAVTSCLGDVATERRPGHRPALGAVSLPQWRGRLLLASDGAYRPLEQSGARLGNYLTGTCEEAAHDVVESGVAMSPPHADNATALVADLTG
ncbi:PP2C family protein-serine/threonine phosphatase [Streptomyces sp. NBC_01207]|uniref:PP2C family protein-serine/threonine phosphatase n=1 Tax=Streptomyces sp. NBC_01207 TaxID=2903772 RepID=UPI002E0DCB07|nr:mucin-2 [Streptomyces sp. NBC_01207]